MLVAHLIKYLVQKFHEISDNELDRIIDVNLKGSARLARSYSHKDTK